MPSDARFAPGVKSRCAAQIRYTRGVAVSNLIATFDAQLWKTKLGFSIPVPLAEAFGWKRGKNKLTLDLVIAKPSGERTSKRSVHMVSGTEVTNPKRMFDGLEVGDNIRVTARNPQLRSRISK
jgi:hypothetical protein